MTFLASEFLELYQKIFDECPRKAFTQFNCENCEYTDFIYYSKDCYHVFDGTRCEDVYYSEWVVLSKDAVDCSHLMRCELCYECLDCEGCYNSDYLWDCSNVKDSAFCFNCSGCGECFLCAGLRNKRFYIKNEKVGEEDFEVEVQKLLSEMSVDELWGELDRIALKEPVCEAHIVDSENVTGDFIWRAKNIYMGFSIMNEQDSTYVYDWGSAKGGSSDNCDCILGGNAQLCYDCTMVDSIYNCNFLVKVEHCTDCEFCVECYQCKNCFGCGYLKHKQYYILNEKYGKDEYFEKVAEIKKDLKENGGYVEFLAC